MVYCYDGKGKHEKVLPIPPTCFFLTTTDSKCWCAIMRSEKTHTLACNEFFGMQWITDAAARSDAMNTPATNSSACNELRMRQRDRVQWMTAADTPSCGQKRHTRWPATNSSACNESRMRQCDRVQWITAADTPSCGQKRHTRWPATNSKCWMAIVRSEKTHTLTCNEFRLVMWPHTLTCNEFRLVLCLGTVRDVPTDVRVQGV